jgi:hypothetical protein
MAVFRPQLEKAMKRPLHIADRHGISLGSRHPCAQQKEDGPGPEALRE